MERSEGVTTALARIIKTMDRSNESLLRSISYFEGSDIRLEASPKVRLLTGVRVGPIASPAGAAVVR
jgi:hypothetical protein